jgi:hypothetical protein
MLAWAASMTWKGFHPIIQLNSKIYKKGISLNKSAMKEVGKRLERNPLLPKWDADSPSLTGIIFIGNHLN